MWLSWAGNLCLFCGWITQVPVIPWEKEGSVSNCRKSEDWGQAVSAEVLPCGFVTLFLYNLSKGRSSLSQRESRNSSEFLWSQTKLHPHQLCRKFVNVAVYAVINRIYNWRHINLLIPKPGKWQGKIKWKSLSSLKQEEQIVSQVEEQLNIWIMFTLLVFPVKTVLSSVSFTLWALLDPNGWALKLNI